VVNDGTETAPVLRVVTCGAGTFVVLDRIDGKSVPGPGDSEQGPRQVSIRWKDSSPASTTGASACRQL